MKIIFLETVQDYGGARISTLELASRLKMHHDIMIVDMYGTCKEFIHECKNKNLDLLILKKKKKPFIITSSNLLKYGLNIMIFILHIFTLRRKLKFLIRSYNPDYVFVNNSKVLSLLFKLGIKSKIVLFARGWFLKKQIPRIDFILYKYTVDKYICVSESTKQAIYGAGLTTLENLHVVHNAINIDELPKETAFIPNNDEYLKILHSGGFLPSKGIHISIEIAKSLKDLGVKFKLIITGLIYKGIESKNYYDHIVQLIKYYKLEEDVIIIKNKTNVIEYFRLCNILIHPSSTEGLPRVIMEAMALKKPVIANPVGGLIDYVLDGYTGFITNQNCVEDYVRNILLLSNDKLLYERITTNAYNLIINCYTKEKQMADFERFINLK